MLIDTLSLSSSFCCVRLVPDNREIIGRSIKLCQQKRVYLEAIYCLTIAKNLLIYCLPGRPMGSHQECPGFTVTVAQGESIRFVIEQLRVQIPPVTPKASLCGRPSFGGYPELADCIFGLRRGKGKPNQAGYRRAKKRGATNVPCLYR